jgi:hypothetical protein
LTGEGDEETAFWLSIAPEGGASHQVGNVVAVYVPGDNCVTQVFVSGVSHGAPRGSCFGPVPAAAIQLDHADMDAFAIGELRSADRDVIEAVPIDIANTDNGETEVRICHRSEYLPVRHTRWSAWPSEKNQRATSLRARGV